MPELTTGVKRFCEEILTQYPLMKQALLQLDQERRDIVESYPAATWTEPVRAKAIGDRTAAQAFRLLRLEENWAKTRFYVHAVDDLLTFLDDEKRRLVELYYFDRLPHWRAAQELHISQSAFYKHRADILTLLAHRLGL